jgi:hypothetical protein
MFFLCAAKQAGYRKYGSATLAPWCRERFFRTQSQYKSITSAALASLAPLAGVLLFPRVRGDLMPEELRPPLERWLKK